MTREEIIEEMARAISTKRVRECVDSLKSGKDDWRITAKEAHRIKPYPMGFYADDPNLYWAIGWGMSDRMFPWERWLVRRTARATLQQDQG
jgi:hypothetical protein